MEILRRVGLAVRRVRRACPAVAVGPTPHLALDVPREGDATAREAVAEGFVILRPDTLRAIVEVVKSFEMPGASIENFTRKSVQIALSGIYDLRLHHDDVLSPVLRAWGVFDLEGLDGEGEKARTELSEFLLELQRQASRFEDRREAHREKLAKRGQTLETV